MSDALRATTYTTGHRILSSQDQDQRAGFRRNVPPVNQLGGIQTRGRDREMHVTCSVSAHAEFKKGAHYCARSVAAGSASSTRIAASSAERRPRVARRHGAAASV